MSSEPAPTLNTPHSVQWQLNICTSLLFADPEPCTLPESLTNEQSISECDWAESSPLREAEDGERRVACSCGLAAGILYPDTSSMPRPSSSTAQAGESETLLLRCSAAWLASTRPSPAQAAANQTFTFLCSPRPSPARHHSQAADSFPSPCWSWCRPGAGLPHQCVISPLSLHPAPPRSHGPPLQRLYLDSYTTFHRADNSHHFYMTMSIINQIFHVTALLGAI